MQTIVTTTVTTVIDLETFEPTHSVDISAEEVLPSDVIYAAALGGARAAAKSLEEYVPNRLLPQDECEDDESPVDNRQDRRNPPAEPTPENPSETGV